MEEEVNIAEWGGQLLLKTDPPKLNRWSRLLLKTQLYLSLCSTHNEPDDLNTANKRNVSVIARH